MKLFGLTGFPLTHSFSQQFFSQKFEQLGLTDHRYTLFPIEDIQALPRLLLDNPELAGLNVTIPWKEKIIPLLHELDQRAVKAGAVNVVKIKREAGNRIHLKGYNTDAPAFRETIRPLLKNNHNKALILGTGGAAKAVASVLRDLNVEFLFVSRNPGSGQVGYAELNEVAIRTFPFIINCTSVGMFPETECCPQIPYEYLNETNFLYDLVYNPAQTLFLKKGKSHGAMILNGLPMLYLQAEMAWDIWRNPVA